MTERNLAPTTSARTKDSPSPLIDIDLTPLIIALMPKPSREIKVPWLPPTKVVTMPVDTMMTRMRGPEGYRVEDSITIFMEATYKIPEFSLKNTLLGPEMPALVPVPSVFASNPEPAKVAVTRPGYETVRILLFA